jgi:hypothetical protein
VSNLEANFRYVFITQLRQEGGVGKLDARGVHQGYVWEYRHCKARPNLAGKERHEPALLLDRCAKQLHRCADVGVGMEWRM